MTADILEFRRRRLTMRRLAQAGRVDGRSPASLETWPMRVVAAVWATGMLFVSAAFLSLAW